MFLPWLIVTAHLPRRPILFLVFDIKMTAILVIYSEIFNYNDMNTKRKIHMLLKIISFMILQFQSQVIKTPGT
jgi:hypothetical protein